LSEVKTSL